MTDLTEDLTTTWLDGIDVAEALSISVTKLRTMARRGEIPAYRIGKAYRFNEAEILDWIQAQRVKPVEGKKEESCS
jgi:excisionase family DNA binding protein